MFYLLALLAPRHVARALAFFVPVQRINLLPENCGYSLQRPAFARHVQGVFAFVRQGFGIGARRDQRPSGFQVAFLTRKV